MRTIRQPLRIDPSGELIESGDVVAPFEVNNFGLQIRYRWTFAPQSDLYVVYGRGGITFEEGPDRDGFGGPAPVGDRPARQRSAAGEGALSVLT